MPRPRPYHPPVLQHRVALRNPAAEPEAAEDSYSRELPAEQQSAAWRTWAAGTHVWAGRRDSRPQELLEEAAVVYSITTVWTIRARDGLDADVEVVFNGRVYRAEGPPVERGGPDYGRRERYLEIHCKLRQ